MQLSRQSGYLLHPYRAQDISSNVSLGNPATTAIGRASVTHCGIKDTYINAAIFEIVDKLREIFLSPLISVTNEE